MGDGIAVKSPEQVARTGRDRARLGAAREILAGNGDLSAQVAAVRSIATEAEGFGAADALDQAASMWRDGDSAGALSMIDQADESLAAIAEPVAAEKASLLARFASSAIGTKIIETGATVNALAGVKTATYSGADNKLVKEAEARADSLKLGGGLLVVLAVILGLAYVGSR